MGPLEMCAGGKGSCSQRLAATLLWVRLRDWAGRGRRREDYLQSSTCFPGRSDQLELELGQSSEDDEDGERDVRRGRSVGSTGEEVAGRLLQVFCCRTRDEPGGLDLEGWRAWGRLAHLLLCQEWPVGSHGAPA